MEMISQKKSSPLTNRLRLKIMSNIVFVSLVFIVLPFVIIEYYSVYARDKIANQIFDHTIPKSEALLQIQNELTKLKLLFSPFINKQLSPSILNESDIADVKKKAVVLFNKINLLKNNYINASLNDKSSRVFIDTFSTLLDKNFNIALATLRTPDNPNISFEKSSEQLLNYVTDIGSYEVFELTKERAELESLTKKMFGLTAVVVAYLFFIFALVSYYLARDLANPIIHLNDYATQLNMDNYSILEPSNRTDEFGFLENNIINMVNKLIRHKKHIEGLSTELQEKEERTRAILNTVADAIIAINSLGIIELHNPAASKLFAISDDRLKGENLLHLIQFPNETENTLVEDIHILENLIKTGTILEITSRDPNTHFSAELRVSGLKLQNEYYYVCSIRDITQIKKAEEELHYLTTHDPLTGLINQEIFQVLFKNAIHKAKRAKNAVALLLINIEKFKRINENYGYTTGDNILRQITKSLQGLVRATDTLSRIGGDKFVLLTTDLIKANDAELIAKKILEIFAIPFRINEHDLYVGVSIGIAVFPEHSEKRESLSKYAEIAMNAAKFSGRNQYKFYDKTMVEKTENKKQIENDIYKALEKNEFYLVYQPKVNYPDKSICGMEVLLRWKHPILGEIYPDAFIPIAEELGLISDIGNWVLKTSCSQFQKWRELGVIQKMATLSVNVASTQFTKQFLQTVHDILDVSKLPANCLELEITESLFIGKDTTPIVTLLHQFKENDIKISIDDFGTGYSSLSYIKTLPISTLKIDKSFIRSIETEQSNIAIVDAILRFAQALNINVIAEGVETLEQEQILIARGCNEGQGYLYSKPLDKMKFEKWLEEYS